MQTKPNFLVGGSSKLSRTSKPNTIPKRAPRLQKVIECHSSLIFIQNIVKAAAVIPAKQMVYIFMISICKATFFLISILTVIFMLFFTDLVLSTGVWNSWKALLKHKHKHTLFEICRLFDAVWSFLKQQTRAADLPIKFWTLVGNSKHYGQKKSVRYKYFTDKCWLYMLKKIMKSYHKIES